MLVFPSALTHPAALIAAGIAILSLFGARWIEPSVAIELEDRKTHRVPSSIKKQAPATSPSANALDPLRQRLEKLLLKGGDVVAFVDELLAGTARLGASDLHVQPLAEHTRMTLRLAGNLEEVAAFPTAFHDPLIRRIKILAQLVTYETRRPQDGRFTLEIPDDAVDIRVSIMPTHHGEKAVLRFARGAAGVFELAALGMPESIRKSCEELLAEPQGLILLTGPTGCGKSTTLYSALSHIHQTRGTSTNLATLEDPIEVDLPFLNQTQVHQHGAHQHSSVHQHSAGGFSEALRAVLRQDPDVLMIGEIRDRETAQTAVQAGLTGHLILSSLHADSAVGALNRLIDIGVEPFLAASAVLACVAQRLVRKLCPQCRKPVPLDRKTARELNRRGVVTDGLTFYRGAGCAACGGSGHQGRTALFELLRITPELRQQITAKIPTDRLLEAAVSAGMVPLGKMAVAAAARGEIDLDALLRTLG